MTRPDSPHRQVPAWVRKLKPGFLRSYLISVFKRLGRSDRKDMNAL